MAQPVRSLKIIVIVVTGFVIRPCSSIANAL